MIEENPDDSEILDWLCWAWATEGEQFYPPTETARECMEAIYGDEEEWPHERYGVEKGQHSRAWTTAVEKFEAMEQKGLDPKARAERYIVERREGGLGLKDIDWSWWEDER